MPVERREASNSNSPRRQAAARMPVQQTPTSFFGFLFR
jgi:hypothetical protein